MHNVLLIRCGRVGMSLPSYQEATTGTDWLLLVAPFCDFDDYRSLCLVSRRFRQIFAPRLWSDLLCSVRRIGLDPGDGECVEYPSDYSYRQGKCPFLSALVELSVDHAVAQL